MCAVLRERFVIKEEELYIVVVRALYLPTEEDIVQDLVLVFARVVEVKVSWEGQDHLVIFLPVNNVLEMRDAEFSPNLEPLVEQLADHARLLDIVQALGCYYKQPALLVAPLVNFNDICGQ